MSKGAGERPTTPRPAFPAATSCACPIKGVGRQSACHGKHYGAALRMLIPGAICSCACHEADAPINPLEALGHITLGHLAIVELRPGDRLVLTLEDELSDEQRARIEKRLAVAFPGRPCLVLDPGMELGVVRVKLSMGQGLNFKRER